MKLKWLAQTPRPGLESGLFDNEASAQTVWPTRLNINPLIIPNFHQKVPFLTLQSALLAAMTLNGPTFCLKSHFLPKKIDFPKIRYKIVQYFNSVYAH